MRGALSVVTAPAIEPVTVDEVKAYGRIEHDADDEMLSGLVTAARTTLERYCRRAFITTRFRWTLSPYSASVGPAPAVFEPARSYEATVAFELPRSTVTAVHSVSVTSTGGIVSALAPTAYRAVVGVNPGVVELLGGASLGEYVAITTEFSAGYGVLASDVPATVRTAIKAMTMWLYENRGDRGDDDLPMVITRLLSGDRVYEV